MNHNLSVTKSIEVNADPSRVWKVLTDPNIIKEYLFGTETITDWKVGSDITFQGEYQGHKYRDKGVIRENILNTRMAYSYWSGFSGLEDKPENYSLVVYDITPKDNNKTTLTWTQKGYASEDAYKHSQSGMDAFMKQIKGIIERK